MRSKMRVCLLDGLLVAVSLTAAFAVSELFLAKYEQHLYSAAGIFIPADPSVDGAAWDVDPGNPARFKFGADGNSLVHIKSKNPHLVYELRPNAVISDGIRINADGFRDRPFSESKGEGVFRILVIGDSITFGWLQRPEETYPRRLEAKLNHENSTARRFEVYNMGVGGYNAEQELELLRTTALRFHPDLVLIGYCSNDGMIGFDAGLWRHFTRGRSRTLDFLKLKWTQFRENRAEKSMLVRSYEQIAAWSRETAVPILVVIFPNANDADATPSREQEKLCLELGLMALNLYDAYQDAGMDTLLTDIVHPTTRGHEVAAEAIYQYLSSRLPAWMASAPH